MVNRKIIIAIAASAAICVIIGLIMVIKMFSSSDDADKSVSDGISAGEISDAAEAPVEESTEPASRQLGDIDGDGKIDAVDASIILEFYAYNSTCPKDKHMSMEDFLIYRKYRD